MRLRLRIACTATWGRRRTPGCRGRRPTRRDRGRRRGTRAAARARPGGGRRCRSGPRRRFSNRVGPKPNVIVRPLAARPSASPVSSGGASGEPPTAPVALTSSPVRHARRGIRPVLQQRDEVVAVGARHHVERREVQVVLDGRRDARLVRAEEVVGGCRASAPAGRASRSRHRPATPPAGTDREHPRRPRRRRPSRPRRLTPPGRDRRPARRSEPVTASACGCPPGRRSSLTSLQDGHRELRERLGEGVDQVGELALVVFGELR